jgi:DcrB
VIPYYFDEAMICLPRVAKFTDATRHIVVIHTDDGAEFHLVIARGPLPANTTLRACIKLDIEEQQRSLRAYELISCADRSYGGLEGIEMRYRYIDKPDPVFRHEFHAALGTGRIGFFGIAAMNHAEACDTWMAEALSSLTLRT